MSDENKEKFKTYSSYEDINEVCFKFEYICEFDTFIQEKEYKMAENIEANIRDDFANMKSFINEIAICETIIRPIVSDVARANNLPLFSHAKFEYDKSLGLTGTLDYLLAPLLAKGSSLFTNPVVCLGEAKRDDFIKGWAQVSAEMIAAQKLNGNEDVPIYGLVSTGIMWQFGCLKNKNFTIDTNPISAPRQLDKVLNVLNWMFCEARKNADTLAKLKNNNKTA